jgi:hypothetical protein
MNKNWLYRVLAMALIVMMALPFAMAEEVQANEDVQSDAVEEAVNSEEVALDAAEDAEANGPATGDYRFEDIDGEEFDKRDGDTLYVGIEDEDAYEYKIVSYKSSNTKVAKISAVAKKDGLFKVTLKDAGKTKLKVKYKVKEDEDDGWSGTKTVEPEIEVVGAIKDVKIFWGNGEDLSGEDDAIDENPFEVNMGYYYDEDDPDVHQSIIPFAINKDGDCLDYNADADVEDEKWGKYTYKWSNTNIGCFVDPETGKKTNNKTATTEEISELIPVFYKPGKVKLTMTSKYDKKKKATVTFKVKSIDSYKGAKKPSKEDDVVYFRVKSAKYTEYNKAEVELYIVNGGTKKLKKTALENVVFIDENQEPIFAKDKVYFPAVSGRSSKTLKIKFEKEDLVTNPDKIHYLKLDIDDIDNLYEYTGMYDPESNKAE